MKLAASDGSILWMDTRGGPDSLADRGWDIVVGPDGNPVVTGMIANSDDSGSFCTFKLVSADGSIRWLRSVPGAINDPQARSGWLALCDGGDVVLCNKTWSAATSYDVVLERYAEMDGRSLWTERYGSGGAVPDDPAGMVRDSAGDLLVAGGCAGDFMVLKFARGDGHMLWSSSYDGPAHGYDAAECVLAGPGDVVLAGGFSSGESTSWDATLAGFDPGGGPPLWVETFDCGFGLSEEVRALALSPAGDLYAAGYGYGPSTDSDILSLGYLLSASDAVRPDQDPAGEPALRLRAWPNPSCGEIHLSMSDLGAEPGTLDLLDASGRRLATLWRGSVSPTGTRFTWDGAYPHCADICFLRLSAGGRSVATRIVRLPWIGATVTGRW
jgi:hypothetical protein